MCYNKEVYMKTENVENVKYTGEFKVLTLKENDILVVKSGVF